MAPTAARPCATSRCHRHHIHKLIPLLEPLDLTGHVVTADALHTQRGHAEFQKAGAVFGDKAFIGTDYITTPSASRNAVSYCSGNTSGTIM